MGRFPLTCKKLRSRPILVQAVAIFLLIVLSLPAVKDNFRPGYFSMHDNLQAMRLLVMDKCFQDHQIPCRWSEDLGNQYGFPIFNFYPPLPYYLGEVFRSFGLQFVDVVKILVVINFLASAVFMYIFAREFWGEVGGVIAGAFYTYAPYHAVDLYVRGAVDEAFALMFFPLIFWAIYKVIIETKTRYVVFLALSIAGLLLSHNPILMAFAPSALVWALFWLIVTKKWIKIKELVLSGIWGFGMAAFFTLPVLFDQQYIHTEGLVGGYYNYIIHFVTLNQLFVSRFWGYGASVWGPNKGLSFQIGYFHTASLLIGLLAALILFKRRRTLSYMILLMAAFFTFYTFLTHNKSTFIWQAIPPLKYLQFPWRLLVVGIFTASFLSGSLVVLIRRIPIKLAPIVIPSVVIIGAALFYKDYFHWDRYFPNYSDSVWFSGKNWTDQVASSIYDYLPITAQTAPPSIPASSAQIIQGQGTNKTDVKNSVYEEYTVSATGPVVFQLNTLYFPGWNYYINGQRLNSSQYRLDKTLGIPQFSLPAGNFIVSAKFTNTPIRTLGDTLSLLSYLILITMLVYYLKPLRLHLARARR